MPTDEASPGDLPEDVTRAGTPAGAQRVGPRHAAPRKNLLTRLHMPAGKAIALAAMPTAVLMGMGLTPTLAQAKPVPKNPFQDGPCVTQPDDPGQDGKDGKEAARNGKDTKDTKGGKGKDGKKGQDAKGAEGDKSGAGKSAGDSGSAGDPEHGGKDDSGSPAGSGASGGSSAGGTDTGSPSPSTSPDDGDSHKDPLGGLGDVLGDIGDGLGGLLGGGKKHDSPSPSATPTKSPSATPAPDPSKSPDSKGLLGGAKDTVDKITGRDSDGGKDGKGAGDGPSGRADGKDGGTESASPSPSPGATDPAKPDEDGKIPFPCVEEKKVTGTDEAPPATIPNQPWSLEASSLTLYGMHYKGVVNLTMPNKQTKQALKFTASAIDIGDLHQIVDGPDGTKYHVQAAKGSKSTIRDGEVTLYTEKLQGNLFGVIPVTFDPEHPPPPVDLPVPYYFTDVTITQAGQFGGNLTIPGLHQYVGPA